MASLRDIVKKYQEEFNDGVAWIAFWKNGRSWNAERFRLGVDDKLDLFDQKRLEVIAATDASAIILCGRHYKGLKGNLTIDGLTAEAHLCYVRGYNRLSDFLKMYGNALPLETLEKARDAAHAIGFPFSERPYRDEDDLDPYEFDGSMSIEDCELMHRLMNKIK